MSVEALQSNVEHIERVVAATPQQPTAHYTARQRPSERHKNTAGVLQDSPSRISVGGDFLYKNC
jgi:hypothetical protein